MQTNDIPLMSLLKDRMTWLTRRQDLLSQNVASADVPGYTPKDLKAQNFDSLLKSTTAGFASAGQLTTTNPHHIAIGAGSHSFATHTSPDVETPPGGNSVSLEAQMIKVADTQAQYQAAANIYSKAISMMKVAIGRGTG
jgi:flagellar basal-body rod protein FlgB